MTWTVMHAIDEKSPLAGYDAERLEEGGGHQKMVPLEWGHEWRCLDWKAGYG
jgi:hypothetical protein